jgi:hypothetical protein
MAGKGGRQSRLAEKKRSRSLWRWKWRRRIRPEM